MYQVCEYGYLIRVEGEPPENQGDLGSCELPAAFWDSLEDLVEAEDVDTRGVVYHAPKGTGRRPRLRVKNYIGMLATDEGALEILPKIGRDDRLNQADLRRIFAHMLATVPELPFREMPEAAQNLHEQSLFEWFVAAFLERVSRLVKRGLRSSYEAVEENLPVLKGRLLLMENLRHNLTNQAKFYVRYDEFTANRAENRLLHAALDVVWRRSQNTENRRRARELMLSFEDIPRSIRGQYQNDFLAWRKERGAGYYQSIKHWCKAILTPASPAPSQGVEEFDSFLFPAERLFEAYVAERLRLTLNGLPGITIDTQTSDRSLFKTAAGPFGKSYQFRPDIVIKNSSNNVLICDTKWKMFDDHNSQISQADLYQMFVYASYWGASANEVQLALIVPWAGADDVAGGPFYYHCDNKNIALWILTYNLLEDDGVFSGKSVDANVVGLLQEVVEWHNEKFSKNQ